MGFAIRQTFPFAGNAKHVTYLRFHGAPIHFVPELTRAGVWSEEDARRVADWIHAVTTSEKVEIVSVERPVNSVLRKPEMAPAVKIPAPVAPSGPVEKLW